ncbi:MAG TPA: peptide chain release factor-like protein [Kiritimatiellae bacterium]|nr:peptide chain release factor-like protein [Kiritimatiellia bacterium]
MPEFPVSASKQRRLREEMNRLGIREEDIEEKFILGSGPGGQKINRSAVCVYLRHRPTGSEVKCAESRSQALNRYLARRRLCEAVAETIRGELTARKREQARIRRQKRRRSRRSRLRLLEEKRRLSRKKQLRRPPVAED